MTGKERINYFMQDGATEQNIIYSINVLNEEFKVKLIRGRLRPSRFPNLNP
jgi:acyl-CoA thioesterase